MRDDELQVEVLQLVLHRQDAAAAQASVRQARQRPGQQPPVRLDLILIKTLALLQYGGRGTAWARRVSRRRGRRGSE